MSYIDVLTTVMTSPSSLEILEQKHAMKILVHLLDGDMYKGELTSKITVGSSSILSRVEDLVDNGLITEEVQKTRPFRKTLSLTEKGRSVAELIREIEGLL